MDVEIVCRNFVLTDSIDYHLNSRLARLVNWRSREIDLVRVTLGDEKGSRGGRDAYCRLTVQLATGYLLRLEHCSVNIYDAISRAVERADRAVREEVRKARSQGRRRSLALMWA